jgi:hypothetical protein
MSEALGHDPEKHALVLDTWVDTGFPKSMPLGWTRGIMLNQ